MKPNEQNRILQKLVFPALLSAVLCSINVAADAAKIWRQTDVDLSTLIDYGFTIVDTNFVLLPSMNQSVEVIYLMKDKQLFRCTTFEIQHQEPKHWCETLE